MDGAVEFPARAYVDYADGAAAQSAWPVEPAAEKCVKALYRDLTDAQRNEICFSRDHRDDRRGLLRTFIANHWQVTRPCVRSDFFTSAQQALIREIFDHLIAEDWRPLFIKQLRDDANGHPWGQDQSIAIIGDPFAGPFQFLFTGRHITLRADGGANPDVAFGGPIVFGHKAGGYVDKPHHPGNIFWRHALAAARLYETLDPAQRDQAEVDALPGEATIGFGRSPQGLSAAQLSAGQKAVFAAVIDSILAPVRTEDRARAWRCLALQGGIDSLHLAVSRANRISAPCWDNWRIEGPAFVCDFVGYPHVHVWLHIASGPDHPANAHRGAFLFPEHDPLL